MRSHTSRVTIGVPVYNGESLLGDMLESLRAQTFTAFRVIIADNASTDGTGLIARHFADVDPRFSYHRNETNIGAAPNFNHVWDLDHSTPYYKWAAHDDVYAPTYLERCVGILENDPSAVASFPITDVVDETGTGRVLDWGSYRLGVIDSFVDAHGKQGWTMGPLHLAEGPDPAQRLDEFLNRSIGCFEIFGVMRTSALERSTRHASYYGSDRALLAQLVLMGRFRQVPERLYTNRYHRTVSRGLSVGQQRVWIDAKGALGWPMLRQKWDILNAPTVAGLPPLVRARCIAVALRHFARRQAGAVVRGVMCGVGRANSGDGAAA